jgi:protein SCO1
MSKKNNLTTLYIGFFILLITGFLGYFVYQQKVHLHNLPILGQDGHKVGAFSFINQDGDTITEKDVQGKIIVAEYFFTTCKSICPIMNENMRKVYKEFKGNNKVVILSHTVDPLTDTVAQMKRYADKMEASAANWHFLTGEKGKLYTKAISDYLVLAGDSTTTTVTPEFLHTERFVLVDPWGRLRGMAYDGTNPAEVAQLIGDIKNLLDEAKQYQNK